MRRLTDSRTPGSPFQADQDLLWPHLRDLPYFRALLRAVEARFYQGFDLPRPVLDVGCGDGHFASVAFRSPLEVGVDPWGGPIRQAAKLGAYTMLVQADAGRMPFPDGYFSSAISNSVLEHIPHIDHVLSEISRALKPEAQFYFCVPNQRFNANLWGARLCERSGLPRLASRYQRFYDRIARHVHLDAPETWQNRLEKAGFEVLSCWDYFSPQALHVLEWGHLFGLPSLLIHGLTGRWNLVRSEWNFALTRRLVARYYEEETPHPEGVCTFYVARKVQSSAHG